MKIKLSIAAAALGIAGFATHVIALPTHSVDRHYYATAAKVNEVGGYSIQCGRLNSSWGIKTNYYTDEPISRDCTLGGL